VHDALEPKRRVDGEKTALLFFLRAKIAICGLRSFRLAKRWFPPPRILSGPLGTKERVNESRSTTHRLLNVPALDAP
jgi:hypothetical protein